MALIKREILTSRKVVNTKACTRNQFFFCKKMLPKNTDFSRSKCQLKRKQNWHSLFVEMFQVSADEGMGKWSKLVEFWTKKLFQICACLISARKAKHLDVTTMFTYSHANTPLGQSEGAYYLSFCSHVREIARESSQYFYFIGRKGQFTEKAQQSLLNPWRHRKKCWFSKPCSKDLQGNAWKHDATQRSMWLTLYLMCL